MTAIGASARIQLLDGREPLTEFMPVSAMSVEVDEPSTLFSLGGQARRLAPIGGTITAEFDYRDYNADQVSDMIDVSYAIDNRAVTISVAIDVNEDYVATYHDAMLSSYQFLGDGIQMQWRYRCEYHNPREYHFPKENLIEEEVLDWREYGF
jgi:hypothetical protein